MSVIYYFRSGIIYNVGSITILLNETDTNPADVAATLSRLPQSLSEAVEALEKDEVLHELLGQKLVVAIKGVRKVTLLSFRFH